MREMVVHDKGTGPPVLMIMGTGTSGRVWEVYQAPAFVSEGFRVVAYDQRGVGLGKHLSEFSLTELVRDADDLISALDLAPCFVLGTSMGSLVALELAVSRPDLLAGLGLMAVRGRSDTFSRYLDAAMLDLHERIDRVPVRYLAAMEALSSLSPETLRDESAARDWLDMFESTRTTSPGVLSQMRIGPPAQRQEDYRKISTKTLVLSFQDDLICPPRYSSELAELIPGAVYESISGCGHYGYLEKPDVVNSRVIRFFRELINDKHGEPKHHAGSTPS